MSTIAYLRAVTPNDVATVVREKVGSPLVETDRAKIGPSIVAIAISVVIMAGLIALRLWFLMPASIHLLN
jgi:hypothetical protein